MSTTYSRRWLSTLFGALVGAMPLAAWAVPALIDSFPLDGAEEVLPSSSLTMKFDEAVEVDSVTADTVTLLGPEGPVSANIGLQSDGRTIFLRPAGDLFPKTRYTLFVKGISSISGASPPMVALTFTTAALTSGTSKPSKQLEAVQRSSGASAKSDPSTADSERWLPTSDNRRGNWRTGRPLPPAIALRRNEAMSPSSLAPGGSPIVARAVGTSVTGVVLRQSDQPLANVKVSIGNVSARTGADGEFVLSGLQAGQQELTVDGRSAGDGSTTQFGYFVIGVKVRANKDTEVAPIYLPKIIQSDWIDLPSPIAQDTVVRTPLVPGMEVRIPKGAVLRDREGKLVTKIALVPMPLDRMPFPFPENAPVYVGVQPGGMIVQGLTPGATQGITVAYPNQTDLAPGTLVKFWSYNTDARGWQIYGEGQASSDGTQVVPDPGVALYESVGFMYTDTNPPPPDDAPPPDGPPDDPPDDNDPPPDDPDDPPPDSGGGGDDCNNAGDGDPVDCNSGLFVLDRPDVVARGVIPIKVTRTYRPGDTTIRAFGYGHNHGYAMYLREVSGTPGGRYQQYDLILPNGSYVRFYRTSPGADYTTVVAVHSDSASDYYAAILDYESGNYVVTKKNGTKFIFSLYGVLTAIQDRIGNTVGVSRNGGQILRLTSTSGRYIDFTYDTASRITQMEDIAGRTWNYTYSTAGYLTRATYPDNLHEDYTYDTAGRMLTVADRKGTTIVTNVYDANGRVSQQTLADGAVYHFAYTLDGNGKVTQTDVTDPRNNVRRVTYDSHGYKASVTHAYGTSLAQTTTYERDSTSGLLTAIVDALSRRTELQRDDLGNITQRTRLAGTVNAVTEGFTYTANFSRLATYVNPLNKTTTFTYDSLGNLLSITDPLSHQRTFTRNDAGQVLTSKDGLNHATTFAYDPGGDLRSVTDALGRTVTFYVDGLGRRIGIVDALGRKALWSFDTMGRVVTSTDPMGQDTTLTYDANGKLLNLTDPNGGITQFGYDARNRRTSRTDALNQSESWTYDGMGNALTYLDRKNQQTQYQYDALNRATLTTYADASTVAATYDAGNRLVELDDSVSGTIDRTYNGLNRLTQEQTPQGVVSYAFDAASRRTQMTPASQLPITYGYDDADRLTSITQGTEVTTSVYDAASRRTQLFLPNGVFTQTSYDNANQILTLSYATVTGISLGNVSYTYDQAGQRLSRTSSLTADKLATATTGSNLFDLNNRQTQANGSIITYDADGDPLVDNSTSPSAMSYTFDARHRLVQLQQGSTTSTFQYDSLGRRVSKTVGTTTTAFLYDGGNVVQESQGGTINPILTGSRLDERFARNESAGRRYFLTDAIGSTVALTDASGAIRQTYAYEPYGEVLANGGSANPYQFTGREKDETGLYYFRARYYSPLLKRFVSEDPAGFFGGRNLYAYSLLAPTNHVDPLGLYTGNFGFGYNFGGGGTEGTVYGGLIIDSHGNAGWYYGGGVGAGGGYSGGATFGFSNANTIYDYGGLFYNYDGGWGGWGGGGYGAGGFTGTDSNGNSVWGGNVNYGFGDSTFAGPTYTVICDIYISNGGGGW